jgi:hypothetical protein
VTEDALWQDRALVARQSRKHIRRGIGKLEDSSVIVGRIDCHYVAEGIDAALMYFLQYLHNAELHIG